ncbi:hypothetical protein SHD_0185, partial [Shewanella decolorationis S12]
YTRESGGCAATKGRCPTVA